MLKDYFSRLRLLSRDARLFLVSSALLGFVFLGGIYAVLLNLYLLRLGYGERFIGLINGAGMMSSGLLSLPVGIISERVGVRRMLIVSMILASTGFVAFPIAGLASAGLRSPLLLATYFLGCVGITVWAVNMGPFLTAATGERERSYAFSFHFVLSALGAFAGSLVAGFLPGVFAALLGSSLEEAAPFRTTMLSASALLCAGIPLFGATGLSVKGHRQRTITDGGKAPLALIVTLSLIRLLIIVGEGLGRTFFNVYLDTGLSVSTPRIGTLSALAQLAALLATTAMPLLVARIGKAETVLLGNGAMALCLLPMALVPHWLAAGGGFIGMVMVMSLSRPAFVAFHQESVEPRWRTAMSGAITMVFGLGSAVAAFGGGYLVAAAGYRGLFLAGAAVSLVGTLTFWAYFIAPRRRVTEETPQASSRRAA